MTLLALSLTVDAVRDGFVESRHAVSAVILEASGRRGLAAGDHQAPVMGRSALKPLQVSAMIESGLDLPDELLAVATGSHSGLPAQVGLVRSILSGCGLSEQALRCRPALPLSAELCRTDADALPILSNCSGKHAAMLATAVVNGWSLRDYPDPAHPLQRAILAGVEAACAEQCTAYATDGCGAPTYAVTLYGLARAYSRLAAGAGPPSPVARAMRVHPGLVAGPGRYATDAMLAVPGLIAKDGAEGLCAAATPDGTALAFKVHDGAYRAAGPVLGFLLGRIGYDVSHFGALDVPVDGGGYHVGGLRVTVDPERTAS
jgi:L-asparaginase II